MPELARKLRLNTEAKKTYYDLIIIGGGLDNFPGFPEGISGQGCSERVTQQARRFGVEILQPVDVQRLEMEEGYHEVYSSAGSTKQVASAVGEGAAASNSIREFLRRSQ
jgi:thioredoxin reductase